MLDMLMNGFQILKGKNYDFCGTTKDIWALVGTIIFWIQIAVPVIIILLGTIDLAKAVISGDEKKIKENLNAFVRRLIYGAAIFFIVFIVRMVFSAIGDAQDTVKGNKSGSGLCFKCVSERGDC